jgi:hypothetical protein
MPEHSGYPKGGVISHKKVLSFIARNSCKGVFVQCIKASCSYWISKQLRGDLWSGVPLEIAEAFQIPAERGVQLDRGGGGASSTLPLG